MMHIPHEIKMILWAMAPVVELRGAIVYGLTRQINPWICLLLSILGSTIVIPLVYYFMMPLLAYLGKVKGIGPAFLRLQNKAIRQSKKLGKYEFWGLLIFVGIPLPGTGAWTGAMIASVLSIPLSLAFPAIALGNVMAGLIVLFLSRGTIKLFGN
jgi:uncharacterized membrane protein